MMTYDELIDFVDDDQLSKKLVFFSFYALSNIYRETITTRIIGWTNISQAIYNIVLIPI